MAALLSLLLIALFVIILKPVYVYLKQIYPDNKPISNWVVVLFIVCSSAILNNQLYAIGFYPKAEAKELVKVKVLCRDISEMYIEDRCFDVIEFRTLCAKKIENS